MTWNSSGLWPFTGGLPQLDTLTPPADFSIIVIGDIRVEARANLADISFAEISCDKVAFEPVQLTIAGTALNMSKEASRVFSETTIVAKIGVDEFSVSITKLIDTLGIKSTLIVDPNIGNGSIIIIRDNNDAYPGGSRLLISGSPAPSHTFRYDEMDLLESDLASADLVFFDGYSLIQPTSALALDRATEIAKGAGVPVCLDLVPHDLYEYRTITELQSQIASARYVISEARTFAALLSLPYTYPFDLSDTEAMLPTIDRYFPQGPCWILRFGASDIEQTLMYEQGDIRLHYHTGYSTVSRLDQAGFGDKIAARELVALLSRAKETALYKMKQ